MHKSIRALVIAAAAALVVVAAITVWPRGDNSDDVMTLEVRPGAEQVLIHSSAEKLFRTATLPGLPIQPTSERRGRTITVGLIGTGVAGQATLHIYLSEKVRWRIVLAGGGLNQSVDFGSGQLESLEIRAGTGHLDLALPRPQGTVTVRLAGAGDVALHVPRQVPTRLDLPTIGTLKVDGTMQLPPLYADKGWSSAKNRISLQGKAGIATVTLDRHE